MSDKMRKSIRNKLMSMSVTVALIAIVLLSLVSWRGFSDMKNSSDVMSSTLVEVSAENSEAIMQNQALKELATMAEATANTVDARIQNLTSQTVVLAQILEDIYANPQNVNPLPVERARIENTGEYVAQLVCAEYVDEEDLAHEIGLVGNMASIMNHVSATLVGASSTYVGTASGFLVMSDDRSDLKVDLEHLDPTTRDWYQNAIKQDGAIWSDVFEDSYGRGLAVNCAHPVYGPDGEVKAVVAIGSQLSDISSTVTNVAVGYSGHAMVLDYHGAVIMGESLMKAEDGVVKNSINMLETDDEELKAATTAMVSGESGIALVNMDGRRVYLAYEPMENVPWVVVTMIDVEEVLQPIQEGKAQTEALALSAQAEADNIASSTLVAMVAGMAASGVLALMVGILYSNKIATPIRRLEQGVREISRGSLDCKLDIRTGDEIENLAAAFNTMTNDLKQYITDLTSMTAEKERIGTELGVATEIQASMLPSHFPAFPDYLEFDVYATMVPAKEVGGDFYDFFLVGERQLGIVMADVSGKGVPAALFMVITKTLIKNYAQKGETPADILTHTNQQLCQNNDAVMFVTAWVAIMDIDTGELVYSNAGHNAPLLRHRGGKFDYLVSDPGFVLAGMENMTFEQSTLTLEPGDVLYLYTDGVTEATNSNEELYSEERLLEKINTFSTYSLKTLLDNVKADIDRFVGVAPQFDDITMLALRFGEDPQ